MAFGKVKIRSSQRKRAPRVMRRPCGSTRRKRVVYVRKPGKATAPQASRTDAAARTAPSLVEQNPQHATQRLRGAPQQLIADRERRQVLAAHRKLAQPADR